MEIRSTIEQKFVLFLGILFISCLCHAQPTLIGLMSDGGTGHGNGTQHKNGTIIQYTPGSPTIYIIDTLTTTANPLSVTMVEGANGKFYGVTQDGDSTRNGAIIEYDYATNRYKIAAKFDNFNGNLPTTPLMLARDGLMYGLTSHGGLYGFGTLYSYNMITDSITGLLNFSSGSKGALVQATDGYLYGIVNDIYGNTITRYDIRNGHDTILYTFPSFNGGGPTGGLAEMGADTLYGLTYQAGVNGGGSIFQFITNLSRYRLMYSLPAHAYPMGSLIRGSNRLLYGMTVQDGLYGGGTIFSFNAASGAYSVLHNFDTVPSDGYYPIGDLYLASDSNLYGATSSGGASGKGVVFQYNINTSSYAVDISLDSTTGDLPQSGHLTDLKTTSHAIRMQPSNDTTCGGTSASIMAGDSSTFPAAVQWQISYDGGLTYTNVAGGTDTAYTLASPLDHTRSLLRAVFSSGDTSASALLVAWPRDTFYQSQTLCYGQSYRFNGHGYDTSGIYIDLLAGLGINGCDSVVSTSISVWPPDTSLQNAIICHGQTYTSHGHNYSSPGIYTDTIAGAGMHGCDSMVVTSLTVLSPDTFIQYQSICNGRSYMINGMTYTSAGTYTDTLFTMGAYGCDSIVITNLRVWMADTFIQNQSICTGQAYTINGNTYTTAGTHIDTLHSMNMHGCDSIVITMLTVMSRDTFSQSQTICADQNYILNGHAYNTSGRYTDTLTGRGAQGCDSIVITNLTVLPAHTFSQSQTICYGQGYTLNGHNYTVSGIYTDTLTGTGMYGCDSLVVTTLTILNNLRAYFVIIPSGTPHVWYILDQSSGPVPLSYIWSWGDGSANSMSDTASHAYASAGYYDICVTVGDSQGCAASYCDSSTYLFKNESGQIVQIQIVPQHPSGISNAAAYQFDLSPNPARASFTIRHDYPSAINIKIIDLPGAMIREYSMSDKGIIFDISDLAAGMYEVQISNRNKQTLKVLKLIKE
jgi:uncharacterized repeat protein (TIGR03803 family)